MCSGLHLGKFTVTAVWHVDWSRAGAEAKSLVGRGEDKRCIYEDGEIYRR